MVPTKIRPMFNHILVTMDKYTDSEMVGPAGLVNVEKQNNPIKEIQTVIAVGNSVHNLSVGEKVAINPIRYLRTKQEFQDSLAGDVQKGKVVTYFDFPVVTVGGVDYLFLVDSDVDYVVEEWGPDPDSPIVTSTSTIIKP